jgi:endonuclease/exonuclease/phosphatase family metal-dependent hydrolase
MIIASAVSFLFIFQMAGTLVESIYILDLLNTALDEKALGLLFFFSPFLLILFRKMPSWMVWVIFGVLFIARGITPYLNTSGRMLASGLGTGSVLLLLPLLITAVQKGSSTTRSASWMTVGLTLSVGLSVLLRTINYSIDYSMTPGGSWVGWLFGLILGISLTQLDWVTLPPVKPKGKGVTTGTIGILMVLTLVYFAFSAPAVIARWTEGNYAFIVLAVSLLSLAWGLLILSRPSLFARISTRGLLIWNGLFMLSLTGTILTHRVPFPLSPDSVPVIIGTPSFAQQLPLLLTLVLFPVIFLNALVYFRSIQAAAQQPQALVPGMLLGCLMLILLVFMNIFTNVWGYVEPVSPLFRNKFWLPFALITGLLTILGAIHASRNKSTINSAEQKWHPGWTVLMGGTFVITAIFALRTNQVQAVDGDKDSLTVMTYNIQQANDADGEKSYERQLRMIQQVSPDILALQESDSARISLNNNDYVRYYAGKLGYYSYYGPTTVSGTYGTAILSKYPLQNPQTVFSYSDQDEVGTAVAEIEIVGRRFTIYNVHPDGSDRAMLAFAETLLSQSRDDGHVIALGDYNLRESERAYQMVAGVYTNAWMSFYPTGISDEGLDMSGDQRIDHIFISPDLGVRNPVYVLPPDSQTDHPVHWAEVYWEE